ncbi:DNA-binding transcriptional regulator, Lrp family [Arthrobacter subterraneus]|uniref:DNA-binding transcriptional regulator, Lrp family n=1 Tax=Arthrobacter subterraneus TaxID=335973 RepID=A0A1G8C5V1_9MICC|nr:MULTISPECIES: Lrp/AsnC family transcriptional regulator [Arthrobacter]SDH40723.1 DNA-binding transcriptional regulator, Lrp family [Arthrobacter subterraneus]
MANSGKPAGLDPVDRRIVQELLADARITNAQLADKVGVAPSTALLRTRQLAERGVITGYHAEVNLAAIGRAVQALVSVQLKGHNREEIDRFTSRVPALPEVVATYHVSGSVDYLIHLAVADTEALRDWVLDYLTTDPVVGHTETTLVFNRMEGNAGLLPGSG